MEESAHSGAPVGTASYRTSPVRGESAARGPYGAICRNSGTGRGGTWAELHPFVVPMRTGVYWWCRYSPVGCRDCDAAGAVALTRGALRMRGRAVSSIVIGLGAFALVAALCVRLVLAPQLVKLPLDQKADPVAAGTGLSFFDLTTLEQRRGETGSVEQHVQGDPASEAAGDDVAVWNFGSIVSDADGNQLDVSSYRVCLDRRTAESIPGCSAARVNDKQDVEIEGLTLTFPFGTEKRDYPGVQHLRGGRVPREVRPRGEDRGPDRLPLRADGPRDGRP